MGPPRSALNQDIPECWWYDRYLHATATNTHILKSSCGWGPGGRGFFQKASSPGKSCPIAHAQTLEAEQPVDPAHVKTGPHRFGKSVEGRFQVVS